MSIKDAMKVLTGDEILNANDIRVELVEVPEWSGSVYVKGMTGSERDKWESDLVRRGKKGEQIVDLSDVRAKLCSMTICDESGKRLFKERDVLALSKKSAAALQRVYEVAQELSGITDADVEELTEELETDPFDGSASDSQVILD